MPKIGEVIRKVAKVCSFAVEYAQDMAYFIRYNGHSPLVGANLRRFYGLIINTHSIEKGLALRFPRPLFGIEKIQSLIRELNCYQPSLSIFPVAMARGALGDYRTYHQVLNQQHAVLDQIEEYLGNLGEEAGSGNPGGRTITNPHHDMSIASLEDFLMSRVSCRMFRTARVPIAIVKHALQIAQSAPSQCNRQATKVHFYQDEKAIASLLDLQGGALGFAQDIRNLLIVSSEITAWGGPQQRNQLYVDGGLFCMNVMLAFHAVGLATCPLNLAITNTVERKIKAIGGIPRSERLVMMIAVGERDENDFKAARSPRRPLGEIVSIH